MQIVDGVETYNLFDCIDAITQKKPLNLDDPAIEKAYNIFMINRILSMSEILIDVIFCANQMSLTKKDHYRFLNSMIPKGDYRAKFIKGVPNESIKYISRYFESGTRDAWAVLRILKDADLEVLLNCFDAGGVVKKKGKKNA
jgi:hypothetical protein